MIISDEAKKIAVAIEMSLSHAAWNHPGVYGQLLPAGCALPIIEHHVQQTINKFSSMETPKISKAISRAMIESEFHLHYQCRALEKENINLKEQIKIIQLALNAAEQKGRVEGELDGRVVELIAILDMKSIIMTVGVGAFIDAINNRLTQLQSPDKEKE